VVGHSTSGWTPVFNVIYWPIRAFERGLIEEVPAREDSIVDFVPVDYVTDGVLALLADESARGAYHLVAGAQALSAGELAERHALLADASSAGRAPLRFAPQDTATGLPPGAEAFAPYFDVRCSFSDDRARELLSRTGVEKPDPRDYLGKLIAYARATGWGKRPLSRQASLAQNTGVST
jgi:long-chain acyl-CoA synthetase